LAKQPLTVFTPSGKRGHFAAGTHVLEAARSLGVDLDSVCGGRGICGRCQVDVSEGAFAKLGIDSSAENLSPLSADEARYGEKKQMKAGRRLGCQARIAGDVVIDVPPESQVHRQIVRKRAEARDIVIDPDIRLYFTEVGEPVMDDSASDFGRLLAALGVDWGLDGLIAGTAFIAEMQAALRQGKWRLTVAVAGGEWLIAAWPGLHETAYGIAYDVGSTTIAAHLCDLATGEVVAAAGVMNPQIRFGEDLMSRVSYAMMNAGGAAQLTASVREALGALAAEVAGTAGIGRGDILSASIVGNPIMHHLVLGLDPAPLGVAPFALAVDRALDIAAADIGLALHGEARVYVLPCIAGHVGADTAGVILSEAPHRAQPITLIVDVGTNAEILLGNKERILACSSPTGPAFEGAQISSGQRAAPGAIERVRIDPETLEPRFKVIGSELWSDDPGFAEDAKTLAVTGICGSGIIEAIGEMFLAGIVSADGVIVGDMRERNSRISADGRTFSYLLHDGIRITQNDVRAIQLAKGALYAGARLLMDRLGVDRVERIRLAGAFGSHIDVTYAMLLGMIPDCDLAHVQSAGNAAGTGARIALLNVAARAEIEGVVRAVEKIETATEADFQRHFVDAMAIPHKRDPFPCLGRAVRLPEPGQGGPAGPRRRRR